MTEEVECYLCTKRYPREETSKYNVLEHFEDRCVCHECVDIYRLGTKAKKPE